MWEVRKKVGGGGMLERGLRRRKGGESKSIFAIHVYEIIMKVRYMWTLCLCHTMKNKNVEFSL